MMRFFPTSDMCPSKRPLMLTKEMIGGLLGVVSAGHHWEFDDMYYVAQGSNNLFFSDALGLIEKTCITFGWIKTTN